MWHIKPPTFLTRWKQKKINFTEIYVYISLYKTPNIKEQICCKCVINMCILYTSPYIYMGHIYKSLMYIKFM